MSIFEKELLFLTKQALEILSEENKPQEASPDELTFFAKELTSSLSSLGQLENLPKAKALFSLKKGSIENKNAIPSKELPLPPISSKKHLKERDVFEELSQKVKKALPSLQLIKETPDAMGKLKHKNAEALMITLNKDNAEINFLKNLKTAIETRLCSCEVLDISSKDEKKILEFLGDFKLKTALVTQEALELLRSFKLIDEENQLLCQLPYIVLEPYKEYAENLIKKKQLWNLLCKRLQAPSSQAS